MGDVEIRQISVDLAIRMGPRPTADVMRDALTIYAFLRAKTADRKSVV